MSLPMGKRLSVRLIASQQSVNLDDTPSRAGYPAFHNRRAGIDICLSWCTLNLVLSPCGTFNALGAFEIRTPSGLDNAPHPLYFPLVGGKDATPTDRRQRLMSLS